MLYVSTRNQHDSFTAHRALREDRTPDGGLFTPFSLPSYSKNEIAQFRTRSFRENVALILNAFFSTKLTGWDIEFCCGRYPVKTVEIPRRLIIIEAWHNTGASYHHMEQALYAQLCGDKTVKAITSWAKIAIRIALLFAVYSSADALQYVESIDLALDGDDFSLPIAALYARKMGLPIDHITCGTVDNSFVWDLVHRGEISSAATASDVAGMEHMIYLILGADVSNAFVAACIQHKNYAFPEELLGILNDGLFVAVSSNNRIHPVIGNFCSSHGYVLDRSAAVSYAALQDYRARIGESRKTLMFSLSKPENFAITPAAGETHN